MSEGERQLPPKPKGDGDGIGGREGGMRSIVVILVGAPGSGKSTFCDDVTMAAHRPWVRICQDNIANGKAGTKLQCLKSATSALNEGKNVFIDRCNLDREQRAEFVKLGELHVDVHAVVLDLPARLCVSRSVKRSGHEGNLQGGRAAAVVNRMLQNKELPKLSEGYSRITYCQNENDVQGAVNMYSKLGPFDKLAAGYFGQRSTDSKVQLGIMKFLKKMDLPGTPAPKGGHPQDVEPERATSESSSCQINPGNVNADKQHKAEESQGSVICTLAFPSISTSDFQFDLEKASDIIVEQVSDFLNKVKSARLVLVDLRHGSRILSLVRQKATKENLDPERFFTSVGDITQLFSKSDLQCSVIANAANWRLKPGGGGVNAAVFKAAGEALEIATKKCADTLSPGNSVAVPLPSSSPLYQREGVTHIIHVLGPNMNPQRPNCLKNDYVKGCQILRNAYSSLFENFTSIVRGQIHSDGIAGLCSGSDQKMKRSDLQDSDTNKRSKGDCHGNNMETSTSDYAGDSPIKSLPKAQSYDWLKSSKAKDTRWGSWAQALHQIAMHPERHKDISLEVLENYVVVNDLYPKGKKHILVLSRLTGVDSLSDVHKEHLPLLKEMHSVGLKWAEKFLKEDVTLIFRLGYHSVPSMRQLHLHVISQDFDSPCLKNKKHWNSFNTAFFRDSVDVMEEVERCGHATINGENLLSMELRCCRCRSAHPNIPRLKAHVSKCRASFPPDLLRNGQLVFAPSASST